MRSRARCPICRARNCRGVCAELNPLDSDNDEILLRRLAPFLLAGLKAPLPDLSDVTRELDGELARRC